MYSLILILRLWHSYYMLNVWGSESCLKAKTNFCVITIDKSFWFSLIIFFFSFEYFGFIDISLECYFKRQSFNYRVNIILSNNQFFSCIVFPIVYVASNSVVHWRTLFQKFIYYFKIFYFKDLFIIFIIIINRNKYFA